MCMKERQGRDRERGRERERERERETSDTGRPGHPEIGAGPHTSLAVAGSKAYNDF